MLLNDCTIGNDGMFGDDDDAIARKPIFVIAIFTIGKRANGDVVTDAGVFVDDGAFDTAIGANTDVWTL